MPRCRIVRVSHTINGGKLTRTQSALIGTTAGLLGLAAAGAAGQYYLNQPPSSNLDAAYASLQKQNPSLYDQSRKARRDAAYTSLGQNNTNRSEHLKAYDASMQRQANKLWPATETTVSAPVNNVQLRKRPVGSITRTGKKMV